MTLSKIAIASTFLCASLASGIAYAEPGHPGAHREPMHFLLSDRAAETLALSDGQQTQIKAIADALKQETENYRAGFQATREQIKSLTQAGTFDEAKVRELLAPEQNQRLEIAVSRARAMNQVWNLLSAEQQSELEAMKERMERRSRKGK